MQEERMVAPANLDGHALRSIKRVYELWDEALGAKDVDAAAALYAPDTVLESPLVRYC